MKRILFIMLSVLIMTACGSSNSDKEQARQMLAAEAIATNNQLQGMQIDFATKSDGLSWLQLLTILPNITDIRHMVLTDAR